jgi:tRNA modification GTPase
VARASALVDTADVLLWLGELDNAPRHPRLIQVHAKADLPDRGTPPEDAIAVSSVTGRGIAELLARVIDLVKSLLPGEGAIALNRRQAKELEQAAEALDTPTHDIVVLAENLRSARVAFDRLTGQAGVEDVLDALFSRFCLGK